MDMKVIYNKVIPFDGFGNMTLLWWMFRRSECGKPTLRSLRHETTHSLQSIELFVLFGVLSVVLGILFSFPWWGWLLCGIGSFFSFWVLYFVFWVVECLLPPYDSAYRDICFEVEAYCNENDPLYNDSRVPFWGWLRCIFSRELRRKSREARR